MRCYNRYFPRNWGKIITFSISSFPWGGGGGDGDDDINRDGDDHHCYSGDNDWELLLSIRNMSYGLEDGDSACDDDDNWNGDDDLRMAMI